MLGSTEELSETTGNIDESYDTDPSHPHSFYILTAVVVESDQRDALRSGLVGIAASSYWHTSEAMRDASGRSRVHELLGYLADGAGSERCVISVLQHIQPGPPIQEARIFAHLECYTICHPIAGRAVLYRQLYNPEEPISIDYLNSQGIGNIRNFRSFSYMSLDMHIHIPLFTGH